MQGFRIHTGVRRRKFENLRAGLPLRGDQLAVLFGGEIEQNAAVRRDPLPHMTGRKTPPRRFTIHPKQSGPPLRVLLGTARWAAGQL